MYMGFLNLAQEENENRDLNNFAMVANNGIEFWNDNPVFNFDTEQDAIFKYKLDSLYDIYDEDLTGNEEAWAKRMERTFENDSNLNKNDQILNVNEFLVKEPAEILPGMDHKDFCDNNKKISNEDLSDEIKSTSMSQRSPIQSEKLFDHIRNSLIYGIKSERTKIGRPKQSFDTSLTNVVEFYDDYTKSLQHNIEMNFSEKRSDTFRNTIFSYLKKLPIKLREKSCSISEPKSSKLSVFLNAFLVPYISCFQEYFGRDVESVKSVEMFLYFIIISYPENKCNQILEALYKEGSLSDDLYFALQNTLRARKGKSKKDITTFVQMNPCFRVYATKILSKLNTSNLHDQAKLMVEEFITIKA